MIDIKGINGIEIIDYLNSLTQDDFGDDISCDGPYTFESQQLVGDKFSLSFSAYYNNWGTDQLIENNFIKIDGDGNVRVILDEPFDSDGSAWTLEGILVSWLETHTFFDTYKDDFKSLVDDSSLLLKDCQYGDIKLLNDVIINLTRAKSLIK